MEKKIKKMIAREEKKLADWIQNADCNDIYTEEYKIGVIEGLKMALKAVKGG